MCTFLGDVVSSVEHLHFSPHFLELFDSQGHVGFLEGYLVGVGSFLV